MAVQDLLLSLLFLYFQELNFFKFPGRIRDVCSAVHFLCVPHPLYFNWKILCSRGFSHLKIQLEVLEQGRWLVLRSSPGARARWGINERDLFIQTIMKSGVEALQVLCGDGEINFCWGLWLGSGQVQLAVGK